MPLTSAVIGLLTALVPLVIFLVQRRKARDPEQRRDDNATEFALLSAQIAEAEARGDFAAADALRLLVRDRIAPECRAVDSASPGKLVSDPAASGNSDHGAG